MIYSNGECCQSFLLVFEKHKFKDFPQRSSKLNLPKIFSIPNKYFFGKILCFTWHLDPTRKATKTPTEGHGRAGLRHRFFQVAVSGLDVFFLKGRGGPTWILESFDGFFFKEVFVFVVKKWMKPLNKRTPSASSFKQKTF